MQIILTNPDLPTLGAPDPDCEEEVDDEVDDTGIKRRSFGSFPAELIVKAESGGGDKDGGVAESEADVRQGMRLGEGKGREDGGERVVGG